LLRRDGCWFRFKILNFTHVFGYVRLNTVYSGHKLMIIEFGMLRLSLNDMLS